MNLALFYGAAAIALVGALGLLQSRDPEAGIRWLALSLAAVAGAQLLLLAPWVAIAAGFAAALVVAAFTFVLRLGGGRDRDADGGGDAARAIPRGALGGALGVALIGALAWVLLGTWGRQLAFPGHDLAPDAAFGGLRLAATAAAEKPLALPLALAFVLFAGALGALATLGSPARPR